MKKLLLLAILCIMTPAQALDKHDLETAIRSLNVTSVKQIIENEKLTVREYTQYLALAEEVIRNREQWTMKTFNHKDVTTPYMGPSETRLSLELFASGFCPMLFNYCSRFITVKSVIPKTANMFDIENAIADFGKKMRQRSTIIEVSAAIIGVSLLAKFLYDLRKRFVMDHEHEKLLRKKYDDAVTIKQLIYAANTVEA